MVVRVITERVFIDRNNSNTLTVEQPEGTPKSWSGVDHMVLDLVDKDGVLATVRSDPATEVDYSTTGQLVFTLGDLAVPASTRKVELVAVDGGGNLTQVINWERDHVEFVFTTTETI